MKTNVISSVYLTTIPFSMYSNKRKIFESIIQGELIVSGITKSDLYSIRLTTTVGDSIFRKKTIRAEVDSRYVSLEKYNEIIEKAISETNILFLPDNIHLTKKILENS